MNKYLFLDPVVFDPQYLSAAEIRGIQERTCGIATINNIVFPTTIEKQLRLQKAPKGEALWRQSRGWYDVLNDGQRYCLSGWITSSLDLRSLSLAIQRNLCQVIPNGRKGFVRFFDPVVLQHLEVILHPSQLGALFYYVRKWEYYDLNGDFHCLEINDKSAKTVSFTQDQWDSLKRLDIVKHVVSVWKSTLKNKPLPFDATKRADHHVQKAIAYGFNGQLDITVYALLALTCHQDFDQLPIFKTLLSKMRDGFGFAEAVNIQNQYGWC